MTHLRLNRGLWRIVFFHLYLANVILAAFKEEVIDPSIFAGLEDIPDGELDPKRRRLLSDHYSRSMSSNPESSQSSYDIFDTPLSSHSSDMMYDHDVGRPKSAFTHNPRVGNDFEDIKGSLKVVQERPNALQALRQSLAPLKIPMPYVQSEKGTQHSALEAEVEEQLPEVRLELVTPTLTENQARMAVNPEQKLESLLFHYSPLSTSKRPRTAKIENLANPVDYKAGIDIAPITSQDAGQSVTKQKTPGEKNVPRKPRKKPIGRSKTNRAKAMKFEEGSESADRSSYDQILQNLDEQAHQSMDKQTIEDSQAAHDLRARIEGKRKAIKNLYDKDQTKALGQAARRKIGEVEMEIAYGLGSRELATEENSEGHNVYYRILIKSRGKPSAKIKARRLVGKIKLIGAALDRLHNLFALKKLDEKLLGDHTNGAHQELLEWFYNLIFTDTIDHPPLLGRTRITFPIELNPNKHFNQPQKILQGVLSNGVVLEKDEAAFVARELMALWYQSKTAINGLPTISFEELALEAAKALSTPIKEEIN
ncbi:hypothetical protein MJO28_001304 [Puccinia striiformis f. sp. tritici]|uniref:Uncharacterized protein n=1 Tax=Puccinia striiformis f. sp. tritici TaxID=168172 RepID=A0ACC0ETK6_9BASI|nr:hypothetical protein MJO28_001304 [Puccinia striiformis f. sp. tritici]